MYHSGVCVDVGKFSQEMVSKIVNDYKENAEAISDRRWLKLMRLVGAGPNTETRPKPNAPSMEKKRSNLYVPSSDGPCEEE